MNRIVHSAWSIAFFCVLCGGLLFGCKSIGPLPVQMKTELGQPVTKTEPQRTGNRANVPAGVKPEDIVAHITTKSGAETFVDKRGYVYQNEQAQKENAKPPDIPKRPWWYWPALIGGALLGIVSAAVLLWFREQASRVLAPVCRIVKLLLPKRENKT